MALTYRSLSPISTQRDLYPLPVTSLAFDTASDTLWTGNNAGSVVAFYGTRGTRGVCFPVGGDTAVKKILVGDQYVRALGSAGVGIGQWSKGGTNKWYHQSLPTITSFSNTISASHNIAISTSVPELALLDTRTSAIVKQWPVSSLITHLISSHTLLLSGAADGYIRTHDVRVKNRTNSSEASVNAHQRGVQGLEVSGNLVFSIGWGVRQSRPFPEPFVKVYDLRSLKPLPPVPFSAGPGFVNVMPRRNSSVVVTSSTGLVNIIDTSNPNDSGEFYQLSVATYISSVAVSSTGVYLAFGDADGNIQLLTSADEQGSIPFNGFEGQPVEWPDTPEAISEIEWNDSTPLNKIGMPYYETRLLSSWTPKFLPQNLTYPPPAKIPSQVLSSMKVSEFVGYATLPKELQGKRNVVTVDSKKGTARFRSLRPRSQDSATNIPDGNDSEEIPRAYRIVDIEYSKFGVEDFDFAFFNRTEYSGLESHIVNSYTNCLVQTFHYCLPIRRIAESHILSNCNEEFCFLCEIGFVSRMLSDARGVNCQASNFCKTVGMLAQRFNQLTYIDYGKPAHTYSDSIQGFHRFLIDRMSAEGNVAHHNPRIVPSIGDGPSITPAPISQLCAVDAKTTIYCTGCKGKRAKEGTTSTHVIDLILLKDGIRGASDLASVIRESLFRKNIYKSTCPLCKQFTTTKSRKSVAGREMPAILALNTSIYESGMSAQQVWIDDASRNGTYVQPFISIRGQVDGVDEANEIRYELRSMIVEIVPEGKKYGHLASIVKIPESERRGSGSPWVIFNDFVVTNVSEQEALGFPGSWKVPCILYYERIDLRGKIDYAKLPCELDLSILSKDINISQNRDPTAIKHELLRPDEMPRPGTMVSIDAEFVSMQQEESEYRSDGTKKVLRPARLSLARVSVLRANDGKKLGVPFIDDHIHTSELIVDNLTEYSGIKYGDLDPSLSRHTLLPLKVAYKKLRLLVDLGCIFIGHGLKKDFRIINLFVPEDRVLDTVDIYYIESRHRRLSLRFLSWIVLKQSIQTGEHDSIEDARCALLLLKAFHEYEEKGIWLEKLEELYREGKQYNWKPPTAPQPGTSSPLQQNTSTPTTLAPAPSFGPIAPMNLMQMQNQNPYPMAGMYNAEALFAQAAGMRATPPLGSFDAGSSGIPPRHAHLQRAYGQSRGSHQQNWRQTNR